MGKSHEIEAEKEANAIAGNLKKRYLVLHTALEGGAGLGVDAEELEGAEIFYCTDGLAFALHDNDSSSKGVAGEGRDEGLIGLGK